VLLLTIAIYVALGFVGGVLCLLVRLGSETLGGLYAHGNMGGHLSGDENNCRRRSIEAITTGRGSARVEIARQGVLFTPIPSDMRRVVLHEFAIYGSYLSATRVNTSTGAVNPRRSRSIASTVRPARRNSGL